MYLVKYDEFLLETYQNEFNMINESKIDLRSKFIKLLKLSLSKSYKYRRKILVYGVASLIAVSGVSVVSSLFANDSDVKRLADDAGVTEVIGQEIEKMEKIPVINTGPIETDSIEMPKVKKKVISGDRSWVMSKSPSNMRLSQKGWDYIRHEEGSTKRKGQPVLKAYSIGDGMITVGWGHAEKVEKSKFEVGDVITMDQAQDFLKKDLTVAADGVRRILKRWEDEYIDVYLSQDQFDVLVSLAYNSGVGALNRSSVMRQVKRGNIEKAGKKLKSWRVNKKFPGLQTRRNLEYKQFMSYQTFS